MDGISNVHWDVLISGTGLPQSLLALALSRSGKRILHLDRNPYYGGDEAALNLDEFESWAERHHQALSSKPHGSYGSALIRKHVVETDETSIRLSSSRAYAVSLAPHVVYNRSSFLSMLVSSSAHGQLEFQAVGSSFLVESSSVNGELKDQLTRIPNGREDIFKDDASDLKAKRALMKFLRFVTNYEEHDELWHEEQASPFHDLLTRKFALPIAAHGPLSALTFSTRTPQSTTVQVALPRIRQYLGSIGVFGPGFGAVFPKWGGLAEVGQVACRACAVGGGVYMLDKGISAVKRRAEDALQVQLEGGAHIEATWLVGSSQDIPTDSVPSRVQIATEDCIIRSISIVSSPLKSLFPQTSEGGVVPAGALVYMPSRSANETPIYIVAHSSESGECPSNQCVLYAFVQESLHTGRIRLDHAVQSLLRSVAETPTPTVLWTISFEHQIVRVTPDENNSSRVICLAQLPQDIAFQDSVLDNVKAVWTKITDADPETFLKFEARDDATDDE